MKSTRSEKSANPANVDLAYDGQIVLVFEGGGALGAYQVGVYQALHESGIEPDWVIGTSIGAINASIIVGNRPEHRMQRLDAFWNGTSTVSAMAGGHAMDAKRNEFEYRDARRAGIFQAEYNGVDQ
jgi:NTE family protein